MAHKKNKTKGSALVFALVITMVMSIIFVSMIQYVSSQIKYSQHAEKKEASLNIAEAGIHFYRWYIAHQIDGLSASEVVDFWTDTSPYPYGVNTAYEEDYEGIGAYSIVVTPPESGSSSIYVESTGWTYKDPSLTRTIRVRLRKPAWSEWVIFSNSDLEIPDGTEITGPVHSNGGIRFQGVANNEVTSAVADYDYGGSTKDGVWTSWSSEYNTNMSSDVFLGGKSFSVGEEDFDSMLVSFSLMFDKAQELNLDWGNASQGHQIILDHDEVDVYKMTGAAVNSDGTVKDSKKHAVALNVNLPAVAVIYVGKNIWVEGTLGSGKKLSISTIHSGSNKGNIYLSNDIKYEDYTSGTILGLVSDKDVEVVKGSANDLHIDGVLFATSGQVFRDTHSGGSKNSITIYGAIATDSGYGFNGYNTVNINYDSSILVAAPPYFPTKSEYVLDLWEEL